MSEPGHGPFVSIVVPVFNGEQTLAACIESLLRQDYPADRREILIVDNGSTDRTADVVRRYPVTYLLEEAARSAYAARNRGIQASTGDLIGFTDAGCVAAPDWISRAVAGFEGTRVGCVAGELRSREPQTVAQRYCAQRQSVSQRSALTHEFGPYAQTGNAVYRRSVIDAIGMFDASLVSGGDADLSWRMARRLGLEVRFVPDAVVYYTHRKQLRALLKQRRAYGYGSVLLYLKYREQMGTRTVRHTYWEARSFIGKIGRLVTKLCLRAVSFGRAPSPSGPLSRDVLEILVFLARKTGQAAGSIKHRVWYI